MKQLTIDNSQLKIRGKFTNSQIHKFTKLTNVNKKRELSSRTAPFAILAMFLSSLKYLRSLKLVRNGSCLTASPNLLNIRRINIKNKTITLIKNKR